MCGAVERRDRLVEHLAALPSVQAALDQIVWHFGPEQVAEVTGRSKRVGRKADPGGDRLSVESRPASANPGESQALMDDENRTLVFRPAEPRVGNEWGRTLGSGGWAHHY